MDSIPSEMREKAQTQLIMAPELCHKALEIHWDTTRDTVHIATPVLDKIDRPTKRQVASDVARMFDVLGWYSPLIISVKILLQRLWKEKIEWDQVIPEHLEVEWRVWKGELHLITEHAIPRCYQMLGKVVRSRQLYGFCDASQLAYAGVVYLRLLYTDDTVTTRLITSKTKVAPLKVMTIPRLELCGAQLLSKLLRSTRADLGMDVGDVFA